MSHKNLFAAVLALALSSGGCQLAHEAPPEPEPTIGSKPAPVLGFAGDSYFLVHQTDKIAEFVRDGEQPDTAARMLTYRKDLKQELRAYEKSRMNRLGEGVREVHYRSPKRLTQTYVNEKECRMMDWRLLCDGIRGCEIVIRPAPADWRAQARKWSKNLEKLSERDPITENGSKS